MLTPDRDVNLFGEIFTVVNSFVNNKMNGWINVRLDLLIIYGTH